MSYRTLSSIITRILTFDVEIGAGSLWLSDAVADGAEIGAGVVGADGVDGEAAVHPDRGARVQLGHLGDGGALAIPAHGHVARQRLRLAREHHVLALQLSLVLRRRRYHSSAYNISVRIFIL